MKYHILHEGNPNLKRATCIYPNPTTLSPKALTTNKTVQEPCRGLERVSHPHSQPTCSPEKPSLTALCYTDHCVGYVTINTTHTIHSSHTFTFRHSLFLFVIYTKLGKTSYLWHHYWDWGRYITLLWMRVPLSIHDSLSIIHFANTIPKPTCMYFEKNIDSLLWYK